MQFVLSVGGGGGATLPCVPNSMSSPQLVGALHQWCDNADEPVISDVTLFAQHVYCLQCCQYS